MISNLYLVPHAESVNNILKSYRERISDSKLTENRYFQNTYLAKFLQNGKGLKKGACGRIRKQITTFYYFFDFLVYSMFIFTD